MKLLYSNESESINQSINLLPQPRGEKERPQSAYPKYNLKLMVDHYPTQEQKKTDPGFPILEPTCFRSLAK